MYRTQVLFPLCCSFVVERVQKGLRNDDLKDPWGDFPDGGNYANGPDEVHLRQLDTPQVPLPVTTEINSGPNVNPDLI